MKKLFILFAFFPFMAKAQWAGSALTTGSIYRFGTVGIGMPVPNPATAIHVAPSVNNSGTVLFEGPLGGVPVSGSGSRFMWIPELSALRAGQVFGSQWDAPNIGNGSIAGGWNNTASGLGSFAHGTGNFATGQSSFALGDGNTASATNAVAIGGGNNQATGDYNFALGFSNTSSGNASFAIGNSSISSNNTSIAMGEFCNASGWNSLASGGNSEALGSHSLSMGLFTRSMVDQSFTLGTGVYQIGSGWSSLDNNKRNSLMVGFNSDLPTLYVEESPGAGRWGKVGIGVQDNLTGTLHIKRGYGWGHYALFSDSRINQGGNCKWDNAAFIVGDDYAKAIIVGKSNECNDGPWTETFHVYGNGWVEAAAYGTMSDKRFKKDIKLIENGLDVVKKLEGVSYKFNMDLATNPNAEGKATYGFIAQEVEKVIPDAVNKNEKGYYSVNYDAIIPFLTEAIKEQQKRIEQLEAQIQANKSASPTGFADTKATTFEGGFLAQNVPNPFSAATEIKYQLPKGAQKASIGIYDMNGKEIRLIALSSETSSSAVTIQGGDLQPGMYMYSLLINGQYFDSKKMVLTSQ